MQEIEDRVSIPFHGKTTKVSPADVIRGWLALQSGLAESSKKTVLGSTDYDGDCKRDRDRKMRDYVRGEVDEWEPEMLLRETTTGSVWDAGELSGACEATSWDEAGTGDTEDDTFDESFADDEEEACNLPGAQLNDVLAAERSARRTVAQARVMMHDIKSNWVFRVRERRGSKLEKAKATARSAQFRDEPGGNEISEANARARTSFF